MSEIRMFAGDFQPKSWFYCQGQTLAINTNQALFSLLGTTYGGNGVTTFCLPDLRSRVPVGTGTAAGITTYQLGQVDGAEQVTLSLLNLPAHTHGAASNKLTISAVGDGGSTGAPGGNNLASLAGLYSSDTPDSALRSITVAANLGVAGASQPMQISQPYIGMNYVICIYGIFPSRN
ncbi:phage tail protein [Taibaiella lutea]|nr:tail fiber protein [Taibaiella lutea]